MIVATFINSTPLFALSTTLYCFLCILCCPTWIRTLLACFDEIDTKSDLIMKSTDYNIAFAGICDQLDSGAGVHGS